MPEGGRDFRQHMTAIKGDANIEPLLQRVSAAGESCQVLFDWDKVTAAPNSLRSHVLLAAALPERQDAVLDAIHEAYFERGKNIGEFEALLEIAEAVGLDRDAMADALADEALRARVAEEAAWMRAQGVTGVPLFIFDGALAVSGAQPIEQLLLALREAGREPLAAGR
jgi:predicted DsbA family dithiol-disulfide isomerase